MFVGLTMRRRRVMRNIPWDDLIESSCECCDVAVIVHRVDIREWDYMCLACREKEYEEEKD
jgi:hypothetical protein